MAVCHDCECHNPSAAFKKTLPMTKQALEIHKPAFDPPKIADAAPAVNGKEQTPGGIPIDDVLITVSQEIFKIQYTIGGEHSTLLAFSLLLDLQGDGAPRPRTEKLVDSRTTKQPALAVSACNGQTHNMNSEVDSFRETRESSRLRCQPLKMLYVVIKKLRGKRKSTLSWMSFVKPQDKLL